MSFKAKDLRYEAEQPAFLQRLRAQNGGQDLDGRHERAIPRAKRAKTAGDDDDDAPTYVTEGSGDTLTKAEYDAMVSSAAVTDSGTGNAVAKDDTVSVTGELKSEEPRASGALPADNGTANRAEEERKARVQEASMGSKKRKMAKVVGADDVSEQADDKVSAAAKKKPKKKGKPIKLSFNDDEAA